MENKSDLLKAIYFLEEEIEGIEKYSEAYKYAKDSDLKKLFMDIRSIEKQHVNILLNWINNSTKELLK